MSERAWQELVGTVSDHELAETFGISVSLVGRYRRSVGIACKQKKYERVSVGCCSADVDWFSVHDRLGVVSDSELGRELGVSRQAVHLHRQRHGIESCRRLRCERDRRTVDWSGLDWRYSDWTLCSREGLSRALVAEMRLEHGFPYDPTKRLRVGGLGSVLRSRGVDIEALQAALGSCSDTALAVAFGVSVGLVGRMRIAAGVPIFGDRHGRVNMTIDWSKWDKLLRDRCDASHLALADEIGCSASAVKARRRKLGLSVSSVRIDWSVAGERLREGWSDRRVSLEFGIAVRTVYMYRYRHGIRIGESFRGARIDWSGKDEFLGTDTDRAIAERFGLKEAAVYKRRGALGIKSARDRKRGFTILDPCLLFNLLDQKLGKKLGELEYGLHPSTETPEAILVMHFETKETGIWRSSLYLRLSECGCETEEGIATFVAQAWTTGDRVKIQQIRGV